MYDRDRHPLLARVLQSQQATEREPDSESPARERELQSKERASALEKELREKSEGALDWALIRAERSQVQEVLLPAGAPDP